MIEYIRKVKEQIHRVYNEKIQNTLAFIQNTIGMMGEDYIEIKSRITALEARNKELLYTIKVQAEKIKTL